MTSDIHFEPFWDPGKAVALAAAPAGKWKELLAGPASADQEQRFADLEQDCPERGEDTSYPLLASSLEAMRANAVGIKFVTVSGDLISHAFACKFKTVFPDASPGDYTAFVEKTMEFVVGSLRETFPGVPVYAALGNNDTDCADYNLDANSKFLASAGKTMVADLPADERGEAEKNFAAGGYFSVRLPAPIREARLVVLDDLFMARKHSTCAGKPDDAAAAAQISWLKRQLEEARLKKERVWVMAHIPPGVDPMSTAIKGIDICGGEKPQMFLSSEELADTMAEFGDVIRLGIFAHTHMDETRLLEPAKSNAAHGPVAVKLVASISPIDGNNPSFTVARVDPESANVTDYRVIAASDGTGIDTKWAQEYDYAEAYHEPTFSSASLGKLTAKFKADPLAGSAESEAYLRYYFVKDRSLALRLFWSQYVCAVVNHTEDAYRACMCPAKP
jgi:sphingomyelin phosphodiesterase acid-like 3